MDILQLMTPGNSSEGQNGPPSVSDREAPDISFAAVLNDFNENAQIASGIVRSVQASEMGVDGGVEDHTNHSLQLGPNATGLSAPLSVDDRPQATANHSDISGQPVAFMPKWHGDNVSSPMTQKPVSDAVRDRSAELGVSIIATKSPVSVNVSAKPHDTDSVSNQPPKALPKLVESLAGTRSGIAMSSSDNTLIDRLATKKESIQIAGNIAEWSRPCDRSMVGSSTPGTPLMKRAGTQYSQFSGHPIRDDTEILPVTARLHEPDTQEMFQPIKETEAFKRTAVAPNQNPAMVANKLDVRGNDTGVLPYQDQIMTMVATAAEMGRRPDLVTCDGRKVPDAPDIRGSLNQELGQEQSESLTIVGRPQPESKDKGSWWEREIVLPTRTQVETDRFSAAHLQADTPRGAEKPDEAFVGDSLSKSRPPSDVSRIRAAAVDNSHMIRDFAPAMQHKSASIPTGAEPQLSQPGATIGMVLGDSPALFADGRIADVGKMANSASVGHDLQASVTNKFETVNFQVTKAIKGGGGGIVEIQLTPEELGPVKVTIRREADHTQVTLWAEKPDVMDHLRRNSDLLLRDLRDSGMPRPEMNFNGQQDQRGRADMSRQMFQYQTEYEGDESTQSDTARASARHVGAGRIDIRI